MRAADDAHRGANARESRRASTSHLSRHRPPGAAHRASTALEGTKHMAAKRQGGRGATPTGAAKKGQQQGTKGRIIAEPKPTTPPPPARPPVQQAPPSPA